MILGFLEVALLVVAVVFASLWVADPSANYEPYAVLFGLLGGRCELFRRLKSQSMLSDHDRKLAQDFRGLFAEPGLIQQYQKHDFLLPLRGAV